MVKAGRIMRTVIEPESNQTTVLEQKLSVGKKLLSVNSPDLCRKTQNNAIFSPPSCGYDVVGCLPSSAGNLDVWIIFHSFITVIIHLA